MQARSLLPLAVVLAAFAAASCGGSGSFGTSPTYTDTFDSSSWTADILRTDSRSAVSVTRSSDGGNSGGYLDTTLTLYGTEMMAVLYRSDFSYTPNTSGAIDHVNYSQAIKTFSSSGSQTTGLLVVQDGKYYIAAGTEAAETAWTTKTASSLTANDFVLVNSDTTLSSSSHPDFSTTGDTMYFGVFQERTGGDTSVRQGLDNFSVSVTTVF